MTERIAGRARSWIRAQPRRARAAALAAAVALAVTGGALVVLQPGGSSGSGRLRHERGTLSTGPGATAADERAAGDADAAGAPGTEAAPAGSSGAGPTGPGASDSNAAPGTTAAA